MTFDLKGPRFWGYLLTGAAVLAGLLYALSALRAPAFPFDDSFISFRYADNLVRGRGLVYNPGEPVEGYTNFLWTLLAALGIALGKDPLVFTGMVGSAALLASVVLVGLTVRAGRSADPKSWIGLIAIAWLLLPNDFLGFAKCGLETMLVAALVLTVGLVAHGGARGEGLLPRGYRWGALYSLAPALLILTRLDAAIFVATSAALTGVEAARGAFQSGGPRGAFLEARKILLERYWLLAGVLVVWTGWKLAYYGDLLPNTYYAKAGYLWLWQLGTAYLDGFVRSYPHVLALGTLGALGVGFAPAGAPRQLAIWSTSSLVLFTVYMAKVGGDFMHYRFAFEAYPLLVASAGIGLASLAERSLVPAVVAAFVITFAAPGTPVMENRFAMQDLGTMKKYWYDGTRSGPRLRETLPENVVLSASNAGMAYYSDRTTIDELGLNDRQVAHQKARKVTTRGHVKHASTQYLISRGVNLQLTHPWDVPCTRGNRDRVKRERPPVAPLVWLKIDKGDCIRMDYLVPTPELTELFCTHKKDFVSDDLKCDPPPAAPFVPSSTPGTAPVAPAPRSTAAAPAASH